MATHPTPPVFDADGMPISDEEIIGLLGGERVDWHPRFPGFGLRHRGTGGRSWILLTRVHGKVTRMTLGAAERVSATAAKRRAQLYLLQARTGEDPRKAADDARASPTFREFANQYWTNWSPNWKPSTQRTNGIYRDKYLLPAFPRMHIDQITPALVYERYAAWSRRRPGAADQALQLLSHMFVKADEWGHLLPHGNPCLGFPRNPRRSVGRHLTDEELGRFGRALADLEPTYPLQVGAVRLLLLTGCRVGEILALRWDDIIGRTMHVTTSKTGPRAVMLNEAAVDALGRIPKREDCPWVFPKPGRRDGHLVAIYSFWENQLLPRAGIAKLRRHDLRHTFASHAAMGQENTPTVAGLLGHANSRNTQRYMHLADQPAIEAADRVCAILARALEAGERRAREAGARHDRRR